MGWARVRGPVFMAKAQPRDDALVEHWIAWPDGTRTPYIARRVHGLGSVTWVAQDLSDSTITLAGRTGWEHIWNGVFDWKHMPLVPVRGVPDSVLAQWESAPAIDLGSAFVQGLELHSRSTGMIAIAVVFFIGYWLLAGPGLFVWLAAKKRADLSWGIYAASAVAATALTVVIVQLVLRGPPQLKHVSVVRVPSNSDTMVRAGLGVYIPRDGQQRFELRGTAPDSGAMLGPLQMHSRFVGSSPAFFGPEYLVPVRISGHEPPTISIPYRSTLKKLHAHWVGDARQSVGGSARLVPDRALIAGKLTNNTGRDLSNVYFAFKYRPSQDYVFYLRAWPDGATLDLARDLNSNEDGSAVSLAGVAGATPDRNTRLRGHLQLQWAVLWTDPLRGSSMTNSYFNDAERAFPMLSLFERLPPLRNGERKDRVELLRSGARQLDLSGAMAAGGLIILATARQQPLPFELAIQGEGVAGEGTSFYQFVLPLDRSELEEQRLEDRG
jgi:hypothetical protein